MIWAALVADGQRACREGGSSCLDDGRKDGWEGVLPGRRHRPIDNGHDALHAAGHGCEPPACEQRPARSSCRRRRSCAHGTTAPEPILAVCAWAGATHRPRARPSGGQAHRAYAAPSGPPEHRIEAEERGARVAKWEQSVSACYHCSTLCKRAKQVPAWCLVAQQRCAQL